MYLPTTRTMLLLYLASLTTGAVGCQQNGTGFCQFQNEATLCGWTLGGNFQHNSTLGGYIQLARGSDTGSLTSRTACSTGGHAHCFRFAYGFDVDNIITLSVSIKYGLNESLLWIVSSGSGWKMASVPVTTNHDFNVIFNAERRCWQNDNQGSVRIDVIRYEKTTGNSCSFCPSTASPTTVPAIPSSCNSTNGGNQQTRTTTNPTTTTTNKTETDSTVTASSSTITSNGRNQQTSTTMANTRLPPSRNDEDEPGESSNNVGIIAGVVVGVIVIICSVLLLLILFRRKRRHSWEADRAQQNPDGHHPNESPPTQHSDSCNIISNPEDPTTSADSVMPIYAVVNKPRKTRQEIPPLNPYEICNQNSEQHWQNAESETVAEQGQDRDGITSTPRNPDEMMAGTESVYQVPRGDPTINSEDQGEEYNALDFEGNRCVAGPDHAEGKHEGGAGDLYSHLNGGDADTYSEVNRQKRPEVVRDEYSHIW